MRNFNLHYILKKVMQSILLKKILFGLFLILLSCPLWQYIIPAFNISPLNGAYVKKEMKPFTAVNWFSAGFQKAAEEFVVLNNPLGPFFVRVKNQLEYSLFDKLNISKGVLGKEKYLYESNFIDEYYGKRYIGEKKLRAYVEKMKFIQDTLHALKKEFIYIQCPGKASFYPEYIPDSLKRTITEETNYIQFAKLLDEYKINYIDFTPVFLKAKSNTPHPLFTQTGIHWSTYSTVGVMDSINNFIESTMDIDLPEVTAESYELDYARDPDADLEYITNLFFRISNVQYAYPKIKIESSENKDLPIVCMVAESYLGNLYQKINFFDSFNKKSQFWFYNCSVYSYSFKDRLHPYQVDQDKIIDDSEIIIVSCTEPNVSHKSWSFIDDIYDFYKYGLKIKNSKKKHDFLIEAQKVKANFNENQVKKAIQEAQKLEVSDDSAVTIYALWEYQFRNLK
jgi:hypothetical protein